jgi:hypothetical protein
VKLPASVPLPLYLWSQVAIVEHGHLVEASAIVKTLLAETD